MKFPANYGNILKKCRTSVYFRNVLNCRFGAKLRTGKWKIVSIWVQEWLRFNKLV